MFWTGGPYRCIQIIEHMKTKLCQLSIAILLFVSPFFTYAQAPNLGTASTFALFTAVGAFGNTGATMVVGDIGTNNGAFAGFPPGTVIGNIHVMDGVSSTAATDVGIAYMFMSGITCGSVIGTTLGGGQVLTPDVYCLGGASVLNGTLTLDALGDPNALFIFKINGAFSASAFSNIVLANQANLCNVYWQINGALSQATGSVLRGTFLVNGAINMASGASLFGRGLSIAGAINLNANMVTLSFAPDCTITGSNTVCQGGTTQLCAPIGVGNGYLWSTGETTRCITINAPGTYTVTVNAGCSSTCTKTVSSLPAPACTITSGAVFCLGVSTPLCASTGYTNYLWNTGATSQCITVMNPGTYSVTVTDNNGCQSSCSITI